jgi:hypothetical protein
MEWYEKLLFDMLERAIYDALRGDADAANWLAQTGALIAQKIFSIDDPQSVRDWAENPTVEPLLTTSDMAELAGIPAYTVINEIEAGRLLAARINSPRPHWVIPQDEAALWMRKNGGRDAAH